MYRNNTKNNQISSVVGVTKSCDKMNKKLDFVHLAKDNSSKRADVVKLGEIYLL